MCSNRTQGLAALLRLDRAPPATRSPRMARRRPSLPSSSSSTRRPAAALAPASGRVRPWPWLSGAVALGVLILAIVGFAWVRNRPARLAASAREAALHQQWSAAARLWADYNASVPNNADAQLAEAHAALAAGRAAQAERALARSCALAPELAEPWLLRLEIVRVEDRAAEAQTLGWQAYEAVPAARRVDVLRALTLALLAQAPEELARRTLRRWLDADPDDLDARVAMARRAAISPRDGDPTRDDRIAELSRLLDAHPEHLGLREALILDLADAGEPERGRALLETWPENQRGARFDLLDGRWALEYDGNPAHAAGAFRRVLASQPQDWATRYRLARALAALGEAQDARDEAEVVRRLRETLDPARLGPRLDAAIARLDTPGARLDLAALASQIGLVRLADAWRQEAEALAAQPPSRAAALP